MWMLGSRKVSGSPPLGDSGSAKARYSRLNESTLSGTAEPFTTSMRLRMTGISSYTAKCTFTVTSASAPLPRSVNTISRPVASSLFSAQRLRAHSSVGPISPISKSSTTNESGTVCICPIHSGLRYALSGCPARPPTDHLRPSIVMKPSPLTARSMLSPVMRLVRCVVARLGNMRSVRATMPLATTMLLPSGVR